MERKIKSKFVVGKPDKYDLSQVIKVSDKFCQVLGNSGFSPVESQDYTNCISNLLELLKCCSVKSNCNVQKSMK